MNKAIYVSLVIVVAIMSWFAGQRHMVMNQIIYSENRAEGFYYAEYAGNIEKYWFE